MREPRTRRYVARIVAGVIVGAVLGCGQGTEVKLADVPQTAIPPRKSIEELPKKDRPKAGSSAYMNRDPMGMGNDPK